MAKTVDTPFDPDQHIGEWGWLWEEDGEAVGEWHLCGVVLDEYDNTVVRVWGGDDPSDHYLELPPESVKGQPWIPMHKPSCEPGAGIEVSALLDGGASVSLVVADPGQKAEDTWQRVRDAMLSRGDAA